jgi:uncharacterized protein YjiS (DUF1127 family)
MSAFSPSTVAAPTPACRGAEAGHASRFLIASAHTIRTWILRCADRADERRILAQLTDWELRDIGISRAEANAEADKWCWRV